MRISIRASDPGHAQHLYAKSIGRRAIVKLDGVHQVGCVTADDHCGMVVRLSKDKDGEWAFDHDRQALVDEVVHGKVEIEWMDEVML